MDGQPLRWLSRYRAQLKPQQAAEKNRLHKGLDEAGIRLGGGVSDLHGVSAQAMIAGLMAGQRPEEWAAQARGRLQAKHKPLREAWDEPLSKRHRFLRRTLQEPLHCLD
jgi:transposase